MYSHMGSPLSVAVSAVVNDDEILLIRRERGDYQGFWALPGGKVELDEHVSDAAVREVFEEAGIETVFEDYIGIVSEHLVRGDVEKHFLLHVCELEAEDVRLESTEEGEVSWFALDELPDEVIPSDLAIIEHIVRGDGGYYECVINESNHELERFEEVSGFHSD